MSFELSSRFAPGGGQPRAIQELVEGIHSKREHQVLLGVTGSGKTFTIANVLQQVNRPALILSHNKTLAAQLYGEFKTFFPKNRVEYFVSYYDYYQPEAFIPSTNTYIEKDLSINEEIDKLRLSATAALLSGRRDTLIVSSVSCIYGIGNPESFKNNTIEIYQGQQIQRNVFLRQLVRAQYSRSIAEERYGTFRVTGDTVDIFLSYEKIVIRIVFWGDEIETIQKLAPETNFVVEEVETCKVFPNKLFVTNESELPEILFSIQKDLKVRVEQFKEQGLPLEAKRLEDRVTEDIEMIRELGYCSGIENYSRYFDDRKEGDRPFCLLDYFPEDFLMIIDESHVTIPQIGGMFNGDRSRKKNLVEHGFRLPAALDNRPLQFHEFDSLISQYVYVSATPGDYEMEKSEGVVVEQIIRPTGLLDPVIEIRPTMFQVDDLMKEIEIQKQKNGRILVTTLTKRMAEELSRHFGTYGIRAKYIHSEIDTLDRVQILRELRIGSFDVLVGINLLREGIDLPEVSLVAIMDADKEGFLRSERSLTQIAGRAARNSEGKVIMYADKITGSMERTIDKTRFRRELQMKYNEKNNITPKTIIKSRKEIFSQTTVAETEKGKKYTEDDSKILTSLEDGKYDKDLIAKEIKEFEQKMERAAKRLDFVEAAKYRDILFSLKALKKETKKAKSG